MMSNERKLLIFMLLKCGVGATSACLVSGLGVWLALNEMLDGYAVAEEPVPAPRLGEQPVAPPRLAGHRLGEQVPLPQQADVYIVQRGDTLAGIARRHGMSLVSLLERNRQFRNPDLIYPGEKVYLTPATATALGTRTGTHKPVPRLKASKPSRQREIRIPIGTEEVSEVRLLQGNPQPLQKQPNAPASPPSIPPANTPAPPKSPEVSEVRLLQGNPQPPQKQPNAPASPPSIPPANTPEPLKSPENFRNYLFNGVKVNEFGGGLPLSIFQPGEFGGVRRSNQLVEGSGEGSAKKN
jgi:LysM repeat protein